MHVLDTKKMKVQQRNGELLKLLVIREIKDRYKGSMLGVGWALINPVLTMLVYTFAFGKVIGAKWGVNASGENILLYGVSIFFGIITLNCFSEMITRSAYILQENKNYIKKIVFPINLLYTSSALGICVNYTIAAAIGTAFSSLFGIGTMTIGILMLPVVVVVMLCTLINIGTIISMTTSIYRDLAQLINMLTSMLMFSSPIFYPIDLLESKIGVVAYLNPVTPYVEFIRWAAMGQPISLKICIFVSLGYLLLAVLAGGAAKRRWRWTIPDII